MKLKFNNFNKEENIENGPANLEKLDRFLYVPKEESEASKIIKPPSSSIENEAINNLYDEEYKKSINNVYDNYINKLSDDNLIHNNQTIQSNSVKMNLEVNNFNNIEQDNINSDPHIVEENNLVDSIIEEYPNIELENNLQEKDNKEDKISDSDILNILNTQEEENIEETEKLSGKELRKLAKSDIKFKPILSLGLNYFTIIIISCMIGILSLGIFNFNSLSFIICGIASLCICIFGILILPDFIKIFLDIRRYNTISKMFSNKNKILSIILIVLIKSIIFIAILSIFPTIGMILSKLISNELIGLIINIVFCIISFILFIILAIKYSLAELICVDNTGPIQSLKSSRQLLKNNIGRYLKTIIPILILVLLVYIIASALCILPIVIINVRGGFSLTAGLLCLFSIFLIICIMMFPIISYYSMVKVEFYDNLLNKKMNPIQKSNKKISVIILLLAISCMLMVLSSAMLYILPGNVTTESLDMFNKNTIQESDMVDSFALDLYYSIPKDYIRSTESNIEVYYIKDDKYIIHIKKLEGESDFNNEIEKYNAEETEIGTTEGYKYTITNPDKTVTKYGYSFMYDNCKYNIIGDVEEDVNSVIESINEG